MSLSRVNRCGLSSSTSPKKSRSLTDTTGIPSPVKNLTGVAVGNYQVDLTWEEPDIYSDSVITGYEVTVIPSHGTVSIVGTTASVTGLNLNTAYTFDVRAINSVGSGLIKRGGGATTTNWNDASGGTVTDIENYNGTGETWRLHTFTSAGTFNVVSGSQPFRLLVVGGGAGAEGRNEGALGSYGGRPGGGGAVYSNDNEVLSDGLNVSVTVGSGGGSCGSTNCYPSNGQSSAFGGYTANGGTTNTPGLVGTTSNISGASITYGVSGSQAAAACRYCGPVSGGNHWPGQGGWGCNGSYQSGCCEANGLAGDAGIVIVAYQIG